MKFDVSDFKKTSKKDEVRIRCVFCTGMGKSPDKEYKLYINFLAGKYKCYRCGSKGSLSDGKEAAITSSCSDDFKILGDKLGSLFSLREKPKYDLDTISWPISASKTPIAYEYMTKRGYSDDELHRYGVRVGRDYLISDDKYDRRWSGRVIFPFYEDNGEVTFLVGRSYNDKTPKYVNSLGEKSYAVYGLNMVNTDVCIVCEGIIDSHAAARSTGIPAVCGLGKEYTQEQVARIASRINTVFLSLDGDVDRSIKNNLGMAFVRCGVEVKEIFLPNGEDPDSLGIKYREFFDSAVGFVPYMDLI